jgi:hypothetical protein
VLGAPASDGAQQLQSEINTLGYPKAALFAFCVALVAYNIMSTVKAALRSVHGTATIDAEFSTHDLAEEVAATHRGMMIAIPEDEWVVFQQLNRQIEISAQDIIYTGMDIYSYPNGLVSPSPFSWPHA